ncbi:hypothetical protein TrLO_g6399 [Triparma laevis f. longispina]|uniref:JmjC domain-containing protein n=1 Tax=Triparma laevis f. longispina TaxID=1714387 RepID=A0A9W6ZN02_9STRA|nr:hypothetical protein TrLO_g6399 [Triparma laevis f. longispina]
MPLPQCTLTHYSAEAAHNAPLTHPFLYTTSSNTHFTPSTTLPSLLSNPHLPQNATVQNSDSLSTQPYPMPLKKYLNDSYHHNTDSYLFGYTYSTSWFDFLEGYVPPTFLYSPSQNNNFEITSTSPWEILTPSIGFSGSNYGVQFHIHGRVAAEVLQGNKTWFLYPPTKKPTGNTSANIQEWRKWREIQDFEDGLISCTTNVGEGIWLPEEWWHATFNGGEWNSFISLFA